MSGEEKNGLQADELEMITAIRRKDRPAFERLYKKQYQQLFAIAYRYTEQAPAAEEIVHDVFLKLWKKAAALNIEYSLKGYLCKSVVNSSLNYIKKENLQQEKQHHFLKIHTEGDNTQDEQDKKEWMLTRLEGAMAILPPKCREAMYLAYFGKLKQKDIAMQMGISVKTVKNHLTYGFQKLRQDLITQKQHFLLFLLFLLKYWGK